MLVARSKAAGIDYDYKEFKDLDNGQIDKKLEEIAEIAAKQKANVAPDEAKHTAGFNVVRYGMCCKLVVADIGLNFSIKAPAEFREKVVELYNIISEVEADLSASSSFS